MHHVSGSDNGKEEMQWSVIESIQLLLQAFYDLTKALSREAIHLL